jgi:flagellar hook protein FlgE
MSFQIALSGLNAASTDLQVTSNNIANANTNGFKSSRAEFADVYAGDVSGIGNGVRLADVNQQFTQGNIDITERDLDLAISGDGFFIVNDGGSLLYSRVGSFGLDSTGFVENAENERLQIYPPTANGFNTGTLSDLQITNDTSPPLPSTLVDMSLNLPADATAPTVVPFDANDPDTYNHSTSTIAYDSLGIAHTATYYFSPAAAGWEVSQTIDGNVVGGPQAFDFTSGGTIANPPNGIMSYPAYDPGNGATPITLDLDLSNTTQFGSDFVVNNINPDGQAAGRLRSIGIDEDGVVFARFSNGTTPVALGKIAMANFSNPEGLVKSTDTSFQETFASGLPQRGEATQSNFGSIQSGALESSNVDLTEQLVNMITAQRLFQANAQVISTMDTVTQTIINIR